MVLEISEDEYAARMEDEYDQGLRLIIRAKWVMDGSKTLKEASQKVREFADYIDSLDEQGYVLECDIMDDYGHLVKKEIYERDISGV